MKHRSPIRIMRFALKNTVFLKRRRMAVHNSAVLSETTAQVLQPHC